MHGIDPVLGSADLQAGVTSSKFDQLIRHCYCMPHHHTVLLCSDYGLLLAIGVAAAIATPKMPPMHSAWSRDTLLHKTKMRRFTKREAANARGVKVRFGGGGNRRSRSRMAARKHLAGCRKVSLSIARKFVALTSPSSQFPQKNE